MTNSIKIAFVVALIFISGTSSYSFAYKEVGSAIPEIKEYIKKIDYGKLGTFKPKIEYTTVSKNVVKVSVTWLLKDTLKQDDWQVNFYPDFTPDFHWAPHLTPTDDHIIAQHVFRAPALIMSSPKKQIIIIPDLDILKKGTPVDWYMDLNAKQNKLTLGLSRSAVKEHVLFTRKPGAVYPPGKLEFGFYVMTTTNEADIFNPWRKVLSFFWNKWGAPLYQTGEPLGRKDLEPYVNHTYNWAFNTWRGKVWQEFNLNGKQVGAPVFIVNVTQSPNYNGQATPREIKSIWNQAWFSSLRSAQGVFRYAKRTNNKELLEYALKTKELALSFPQKNGFFPGLIGTETERVEQDGKTFNRPKGWEHFYFGNSNRNPYVPNFWTGDTKKSPLHILDMSFTAYLMLTWYDELEKDKRLLNYATAYADALLKIQTEDGFFPAWLSQDLLKPMQHLNKSPESSMSVTFLLKLYELTKDERYFKSAAKAMQAVIKNNILIGQWEDFETYWSCSTYGGNHTHGGNYIVGEKVERNNMFKQNNYSMYWTAEALFNLYKITKDEQYKRYGQRTLDEMLMTQATWQPPYIYVNALGGFGVMNGDGEWNDARQSIFSELIIKYGKEFQSTEYIQRGLAALRASFVMMYAEENPRTLKQWESKWSFFGKEDYGFMMENYGHAGITGSEGVGIGDFTIYDWGNGAASEAYNRILDHYHKEFIINN